MKNIILAVLLFIFVVGCAGPNPNPGERTTDMAWTSGDYERAFKVAKPRAESGEPWAQLRLAIFYENGWGVERNLVKAYDWYLKTVSQKADGAWAKGKMIGAAGPSGYFNQNSDALIAEYNLANLYYNGEGIERDLVKSYVHINNVINESEGKSVFFCCEFSGGRAFVQSQFLELKGKLESIMTPGQLIEAKDILNKISHNK